jgi:hypothetical protein
MTTIAFDGKTLAVDRAAWKGQGIWSDACKLFAVDMCGEAKDRFMLEGGSRIVWAACGCFQDFPLVIRWIANGGDIPDIESGSIGILVHGNDAYGLNSNMTLVPHGEYPISDGCGHEMVLGCMLAGADAVRAIELVASRSSFAVARIDSYTIVEEL